MWITVNFQVQINATRYHSNFEIHSVVTEQLFNALKAIETLAEGTMKVYGRPEDQGLDRCNDIAQACLRLGPYHSGSPGPGPRAVHKPSQCPQLRLLLLKYVAIRNLFSQETLQDCHKIDFLVTRMKV